MDRSCRANRSRPNDQPAMSKTSKSMNHSAWEGHANEKRFMDALTNFMKESWTVVCQVRERSGLSSNYEMSSTEISKRIDDVSKRLDDKYKEVQKLEAQKALLVNKSPTQGTSGAGAPCPRQQVPADFQPVASSTPTRQMGYSGNYPMSYSGGTGGSSGNWPSTTASGSTSSRRRLQFTGGSSGSECPPSCEYSEGSSGGYRSFGDVDYGF